MVIDGSSSKETNLEERVFNICQNFEKEDSITKLENLLSQNPRLEKEYLVQSGQIPTVNEPIKSVIEKEINSEDAYILSHGNNKSLINISNLESDYDFSKHLIYNGGYTIGRGNSNQSLMMTDNTSGISEHKFKNKLLTPHPRENNKFNSNNTQGKYGIGAHTVIPFCKGQLIGTSCRSQDEDVIRYTLFWENEGKVYYLTIDGEIPRIQKSKVELKCENTFKYGTFTKIFNPNLNPNPREITKETGLRRLILERPIEPTSLCITDNRGKKESQSYTYKGAINHFRTNYSEAFRTIKEKRIDSNKYLNIDGDIIIQQLTLHDNYKSRIDNSNNLEREFPPSKFESKLVLCVNGQRHAQLDKIIKNVYENLQSNTFVIIDLSEIEFDASEFFIERRERIDPDYEKRLEDTIRDIIENDEDLNKANDRSKDSDLLDPVTKFEPENGQILNVSDNQDTAKVLFRTDSNKKFIEQEVEIKSRSDRIKSINIKNNAVEVVFDISDITSNEYINVTLYCNENTIDQIIEIKSNENNTIKKQNSTTEENTNYKFKNSHLKLVGAYLNNKHLSNYNVDNSGNSLKNNWAKFEGFFEELVNTCDLEIVSKGGENHPPDLLLNEFAVESKKVTGFGSIQMNSSLPKSEMSPENNKLKKETRNILQNSNNPERDLFYSIGVEDNNQLEQLWFCQGKTILNESNNLNKIINNVSMCVNKILNKFDVEVNEDTNEVAGFKLGRIGVRFRKMCTLKHPLEIFNDEISEISRDMAGKPFILTISENKFKNICEEDREKINRINRINKYIINRDEKNPDTVVLVAR